MRERHGMRQAPIYGVWSAMKSRCENPRNPAYANYGGRGITVCERWKLFSAFLADMGEAPRGLSLDRIDNSLGYSPENCRWASRAEQARNHRGNRILTLGGESLPMIVWAERYGVRLCTVHARLAKGWTVEKAIQHPVRQSGRWGAQNGVTFTETEKVAA